MTDGIAEKPRSTAVTVIAWGMLLYGILLTLICTVLYFVIPDLAGLMRGAKPEAGMVRIAAILAFMLEHVHTFLLFCVFLYLLHVAAGAGLLKRTVWGRLLAVVVSTFMIVSALVNLGVGAYLFVQIRDRMDESVYSVAVTSSISSIVMTVVWTGIYVFIIYKLTRREVVTEFEPDRARI
jgi:hypothetical protein